MSQPSQKMDGFEFNSVASYYSTINSTNAQLNYSLGLSRVNSVFVNFIRSNYLNNLSQNSLQTMIPVRATGQIADVNSVTFTKGGVRYPDSYVTSTNYKLDSKVSPVDPEVSRKFLNSIVPFKNLTRTQISPFNTNRDWTTNDNSVAQGGLVWGVGVNYNTLGSQGENFMTQAWGLEMDLDLTDDNPISAFVFVNAKNTLMFNNDGVQLVS